MESFAKGQVEQSIKTRLVATFFILAPLVLFTLAWQTVDPKVTDFPAFYSAARLWERGENPYDLQAQCTEQIPIRGEPCLPFAHPPVLLPLVALASSSDFVSSYNRWVALMLGITLLCLIPLYLLSRNWKISVQSLLFIPVFIGIVLGQDTALIILGVLFWVVLLVREKDLWSGIALSLLIVKPQIAILIGLPLFLYKKRAFLGFCIGISVLSCFSFLLVGSEGLSGLLSIARVMAHGQGYGVNQEAMFNATGLALRLGLGSGAAWVLFVSALLGISLLWRRSHLIYSAASVSIIVSLFCAPHLHAHDLSLLIVPLLFIHPLAPSLASVVLLMSYSIGLQHWVANALMLILALAHLKTIVKNNLDLEPSPQTSISTSS